MFSLHRLHRVLRGAARPMIAGAVLALLAPSLAPAQGTPTPPHRSHGDAAQLEGSRAAAKRSPTSITVVLVDSGVADGAIATLVRRAKRQPQNVLLLSPRSASPESVIAALTMLSSSRRELGDSLAYDYEISIGSTNLPAEFPRAELARVNALLARLGKSAPQTIGGIGTGRAVTLQVGPVRPAPAMR